MANTLAPTENCLGSNYVAVRLKDRILVFSKKSSHAEHLSGGVAIITQEIDYAIWICNLWTEQWRKYTIPGRQILPEIKGQTGVAIGSDIYIFGGGYHTDMFWKLRRSENGSFVWSIIPTEDKAKVPSPRLYHCAWEHGEKMWVFGGYGPSPDGYLNDYGDFSLRFSWYVNNQLLSYDPSTMIWISVKCSGEVPSTRYKASLGIMEDSVWLYGGSTENGDYKNDLYKLNMHSFVWTTIKTSMPGPDSRAKASLTLISENQLLLWGGYQEGTSDQDPRKPWIFDVQSHKWRRHRIAASDFMWNYTCITGLNNRAIILGGKALPGKESQHQASVMLEPKCLQQLAIQMIYRHKSKLPWENLPKKLTFKIKDIE